MWKKRFGIVTFNKVYKSVTVHSFFLNIWLYAHFTSSECFLFHVQDFVCLQLCITKKEIERGIGKASFPLSILRICFFLSPHSDAVTQFDLISSALSMFVYNIFALADDVYIHITVDFNPYILLWNEREKRISQERISMNHLNRSTEFTPIILLKTHFFFFSVSVLFFALAPVCWAGSQSTHHFTKKISWSVINSKLASVSKLGRILLIFISELNKSSRIVRDIRQEFWHLFWSVWVNMWLRKKQTKYETCNLIKHKSFEVFLFQF